MFDAFGNPINDSVQTMAGFLDQSAFDEKFEVDLDKDWIRNLYHIENKYYVPVLEGCFSDMYAYSQGHMVHDNDQSFNNMLDPSTLKERLKNSETPGMLKAECREKLVDGSYRWVQYLALAGEENGVPENLIYFYVYDIQNQKDRLAGKISVKDYSRYDRDQLTGLIRAEEFITAASELKKSHPDVYCCLAFDIHHFKIFNAWFGREKGDYVLARIGNLLRDFEKEQNAVAAYFRNDNFCVFLKYDKELIINLYDAVKGIITDYSNMLGFLPAFGVNIIGEQEDTLNLDVYDKARIAVETAKLSYHDRIAYFDPRAYDDSKKENDLMAEFQIALKKGEISFYVQPQCQVDTGKIIGGEALVRWKSSDGALIIPGAFVPFLERYGFISELDKYIWRSVVLWIRNLLDQDVQPVPVSINISQYDLLALDVPAYLYGLTESFNVPARYIKVEITESAYADNYDLISDVVAKLKDKGFSVYLDDFGAGYSSLNMLDEINVDALKLDMGFMRKRSKMTPKGVGIMESIVSMSKTIGLPIIVEGVENEDQVEFLNSLGCRYAQGYHFYKPMPQSEFVKLLCDRDMVDYDGIKNRSTEMFHVKEFLNESLFTDTMLNTILGPVAFYAQNAKGELSIIKYNQQFYNCISDVKMDSRKTSIHNYILESDQPKFFKMLEEACVNPVDGGECTVRFIKSDGGVHWYYMHLHLLKENAGEKIYYGKIANATGMYKQSEAFFELLRDNSDYCMRMDLQDSLIYEIGREKAFDDPNARVMDAMASLQKTADEHIDGMEERKRFVDFFNPERMRQANKAGVYSESIKTNFKIGGQMSHTQFSAYYIKFLSHQEDNVYIFVNREF